MRNEKDWRQGFRQGFEVGDTLVTASGIEITVKNIGVQKIWARTPHVVVVYDFNDNGRRGSEQVTLDEFINRLAE
ncbi:MAG: hypothetical protein ACREIS_08210 [Nitrospiraceae bacterium]